MLQWVKSVFGAMVAAYAAFLSRPWVQGVRVSLIVAWAIAMGWGWMTALDLAVERPLGLVPDGVDSIEALLRSSKIEFDQNLLRGIFLIAITRPFTHNNVAARILWLTPFLFLFGAWLSSAAAPSSWTDQSSEGLQATFDLITLVMVAASTCFWIAATKSAWKARDEAPPATAATGAAPHPE
ncbi:MAG: hypothetical protein NXI12_04890 [Alphaproteobacteria bacterium]|nr:hypothetical protein [Alphaproteobacteria bacterium]